VSLLVNPNNRVVPFPFIYVGTNIVHPSVLEISDSCRGPLPMDYCSTCPSNCLDLPSSCKCVIYFGGKCAYTNRGLLHQWHIDKVHVDSNSHFIAYSFFPWLNYALCYSHWYFVYLKPCEGTRTTHYWCVYIPVFRHGWS
jgi:hypothetical protein